MRIRRMRVRGRLKLGTWNIYLGIFITEILFCIRILFNLLFRFRLKLIMFYLKRILFY